MNKIDVRLIHTDSIGLFHDSRKDVRNLGKLVNLLIDKVNELVDENEKLKKQVQALSHTNDKQ